MYRAERIKRLAQQAPSLIEQGTLKCLLLSSSLGQTSRADEMATAIYYRYCHATPEQYGQIGRRLDISPENARRLCARGVRLLSDPHAFDLLSRTIEKGSRLWEAIKKHRPS